LTGYTPAIERVEPVANQPITLSSSNNQSEQWFYAVNKECKCRDSAKCGDALRVILAHFRSAQAMSTAEKRRALYEQLQRRQVLWLNGSNGHNRASSAVCNYKCMPKEMLPRVSEHNSLSPHCYPYLAQQTVDDVLAMRHIHAQSNSSDAKCRADWLTLQARLQQYAVSGKGTVAEAMLYNDCYWRGQISQ
jgi:hypothetical protein